MRINKRSDPSEYKMTAGVSKMLMCGGAHPTSSYILGWSDISKYIKKYC